MTDRNASGGQPGPNANQGFGAPGSPSERDSARDSNAPASEGQDMKHPTEDGLDPEAIRKKVKSSGELVGEEQLDEDLSVTGAPPEKDGPENAPDV